MADTVKVRAVFKRKEKFGFYGGLIRKHGDEFQAYKDDVGSWMQVIEQPKRPGPKPRPKPAPILEADE